MKIEDIDIDRVLYVPQHRDYDYDDEEEGLFKKLFSKKSKKHEKSVFEERIEAIGHEELLEELSGDVDAYLVQNADFEHMVVLTDSYLIFPGNEIFELFKLNRFGIYNISNAPFAEYAEDRFDVPYDPQYVSEFEGEEDFEFDRFKIRLEMIDDTGFKFIYLFHMEVEDREDFRQKMEEKSRAKDFSSKAATEGWFKENDSDSLI